MADEQKTTTPDRATYTSLNLGRESVDRHPSQQPETLYSSPAQRAALLRTCGGAAILLGIVVSLVASAAMVATAPPPVGTVRFGLPQPQAKRSVAGRLRQRLVVDVGEDNFGVVARRYGGAAPAPTLLVEPGDTLTVDVQNKLGPEAQGDSLMTGLHRPNTTSLHVHGWHVSPREDDVFTLIAPGSSKTYVYHLPSSHPAGTFWYHAHGHGSSSLQAGWMAGALVVHDKDHRRLPPDVVLLLTQVNLVAGKARNYAWASYASGSKLPVVRGKEVSAGSTDGMASALAKQLRAPLNASFFAVNGLRIPTLRPPAKAWVRFRLIHAGTNDVLALHLQDEQACETYVVARDGYTLQDPRGDQLTRESPLVLAPGSRADVYARCSRRTSLKSAFSEDLKTYLGSGSDVYSGSIIKIRPTASQVVTKDTDDVTTDPRFPTPPDIPSLLAATPDRIATLEMVQRGAIVKDGNGYTDYALDVVQGDGSVTVGDVVEWTVVNMHKGAPGQVIPQDTTHPFHVHTNHFQVAATSHGDGVDYSVGDWRDTITLPTPGNVTVRFRAADFDGPSLAHCHIFSHADLGMLHAFSIEPAE
mmetsp:Transcript_13541/g.36028  ORF Transcript_13541/g.36028 Transcript_13541/m.36028 type:complete len:586 (-) Transcript_13541:52-1809(-)